MGNEPDFDPLNATPAREDDMMRGYRAAGSGGDLPPLASVAFEPGWRMRRNDAAHVVDTDQRVLAGRLSGRIG